ncbi:MAG: hypothetical protein NTV46_04650 [Verrucomicrobia bacterium]|nr:hypothetical protein [Verrucomicrobiota bacterium]
MTFDPLGGDVGHAINGITTAADDRTQGRVLQSGEPFERDLIGALLVGLQATPIRAERKKPPHGHRLPGLRV